MLKIKDFLIKNNLELIALFTSIIAYLIVLYSNKNNEFLNKIDLIKRIKKEI